MKRSWINKRGKKTLAWDAAKRVLKKRFLEMGITRCELRYGGCYVNNFLSWAHAVKQRFIRKDAAEGDPDHMLTVILSCQSCHSRIERLKASEMKEIVMATIAKRAIDSHSTGR